MGAGDAPWSDVERLRQSAAEDASPDYNSDGGAADSQAGLFPVRSPLLRESWLVSLPPLIDMLKLSG